jgi:predicted nucleic acid-binding protein
MEKILDANLIIRYLVEDDKKKVDAIEKLFKSDINFILTDVTISEIIWVLISYYKQKKQSIINKIASLIHLPNIKSNKVLIVRALEFYKKFDIDWIDAYISAYAVENKIKEIYSYDKDLDKIKNIKRLEPTI